MWQRVRRWYEGDTRIQEFDNDPDSPVVILPGLYTEYHWTATVARALVAFYQRHWQWLWGILIAVATLYYTAFPRK
ncbi:hypothetical protein LJR296_006970 [Cupriavidus necator]|uniref:hypothetical protein n=1 Tax=Cupriavidus necator TaxID=106590 RepID=UPI003ECD6A00